MTDSIQQIEAEVRAQDSDIRVLNLCFDVVMYTFHDFTAIPDAVLYFYNRCMAYCPQGALKWYATENMSKHKPVTARTLAMVPGWLKKDAPPKPILHIHLKDGENYADAAGYALWLWGNEAGEVSSHGEDANVVRFTVPASHVTGRVDELKALVLDLAGHFPFDSGHAGYVLETTQYRLRDGERAAFPLSMSHPGLDIANPISDSVALARTAIKGVNWLTLLCAERLAQAGGAAAFEPLRGHGVSLQAVGTGVLIQAGPVPVADDGSKGDALDAYRAVYRVLAPLQAPLLDRYSSFNLPGGTHREKTREWLLRLGHG